MDLTERRVDEAHRAGHLWLEQDDTLVSRDRQQILEVLRPTGSDLRYAHLSAGAEPLLAIPDAVAWAWAKGGDWRRRCQPIVGDVIDV